MRKPLVFMLIFMLFVINACSSNPFGIKLPTGDYVKLLNKGADFRLYEHERGYVLLKAISSSKNAQTLQNELNKSQQANLQAFFGINLRADDYAKIGFDNEKIQFGEYRPINIGKSNISGVVSEITANDNRYRELVIFCSAGRAYLLYYISAIRDNSLYKIVDGISSTEAPKNNGLDITTDLTIVPNLDIGHDKEGKPYAVIYKKKDEIARAASKSFSYQEWIGIVVWIGNGKKDIQDATIDAKVELNGRIIKNNYNAFFDLEPHEACEYSLLLPIEPDLSKNEISKLIDEMQITLRYKENEAEKLQQLK